MIDPKIVSDIFVIIVRVTRAVISHAVVIVIIKVIFNIVIVSSTLRTVQVYCVLCTVL